MIRPYSPSDKPAVLHIWREASAIAHPFLSAALVAQAEAMIRDQFLDLAETWMIDADDTPAGFIALLGNALPTRAKAARRQKAVAACAAMVGALVLSRAVDDPALSEEFLDAVAAQLPGTH